MHTKNLLLFLVGAILLFPDAVGRTDPAPGRYACEADLLEVMFVGESVTRLRAGRLVDESTQSTKGLPVVLDSLAWHRWSRITSLGEAEVDGLIARGEQRGGRPLYDLNNVFRLRVPPTTDVWQLSSRLASLPGVLRVSPVPRPVAPPLPADHEPQQNYLDPAAATPTGVDAEYAWTQPGGRGEGVTVCDLEYFWSTTHADVTKAVGSLINADVADPGYGPDHGTAVIGELVADDNGWGVTGIVPDASLKTCGTYYGAPQPSWNVPGAMLAAIAALQEGDVILLENQWDYTGQEDYVPIEWWTDFYPAPQSYNPVYAAIETAVANGIHVVETGGNGEGDSGTITWFGDSGAIVVGAGGAYAGGTFVEGDMQKLSLSTYGPRFDLQGWGEDVVTSGFGDLFNAEGPDYAYTAQFGGTSAAGPMVAGTVAACIGHWKANRSTPPPDPLWLRDLLKSTGTPQITPPAGNIGPRPDLRAAFAVLDATAAAEAPFRSRLRLEPAYPNPLNPITRIDYAVDAAGPVSLTVLDLRGRLVRRLTKGWQMAGENVTTWDGRADDGAVVASGAYLIRLTAAGESRVVKATVLK